jgi:hypothetical protein
MKKLKIIFKLEKEIFINEKLIDWKNSKASNY